MTLAAGAREGALDVRTLRVAASTHTSGHTEIRDRGRSGERPVSRSNQRPFRSVTCVTGRTVTGRAAREQAVFLAGTRGVEWISRHDAARDGHNPPVTPRDAADLVVLGPGKIAFDLIERATVPVLVARPVKLGARLTDLILVACSESAASGRAVHVAGALAAFHGGAVAIVPASARDPAELCAVAAASRTLFGATGVPAAVIGEPVPPERAVPAVAAAVDASLVVVAAGPDGLASIARCVGCSVLAVPAAVSAV